MSLCTDRDAQSLVGLVVPHKFHNYYKHPVVSVMSSSKTQTVVLSSITLTTRKKIRPQGLMCGYSGKFDFYDRP